MNTTLCFAFVSLACAALAGDALSQRWSRAYRDVGRDTTPAALCATAGGGFAIAGHSEARFPRLLRLDAAGNLAWQYGYEALGDDRGQFFDVAMNTSAHLVAVGHHDHHPYFLVADGRLGPRRRSVETTYGRGALLGVLAEPGGGFVATGWIANAQGDADLLVVRTDASGDEVWQRRFGRSGRDEFGDCVVPFGGDYLIAGRTTYIQGASVDLALSRVTPDGDLVWQRAIGTVGLDAVFGTPVASVASDGSVFVVAGRDHTGGTGDDIWLLEIAPSGRTNREIAIDHAVDAPRSVRATPDGGCVILAETTEVGSDDRDAWLIKVDATGAIEWQRRYGSAGADDAVDVELAPDGGYVLLGASEGFGTSLTPGKWTWVLRVDAAGRIGRRCWVESDVTATTRSVSTGLTVGTFATPEPLADGFRSVYMFDGLIPTLEAVQCTTNAGPWTDLGHGTGGAAPLIELAGAGTLWAGDRVHVVVNDARPGGAGALLLGTSVIHFPVLGETIVPLPEATVAVPVIAATGSFVQPLVWPIALPVGFEIYMQFAAVDAAGPQGLVVSNGIAATTQ